jgi:hypothetical protein
MNSNIGGLKQAQFFDEPEGSRYLRLPRPGTRCPHSGLSRSTLREMCVPCKENGFRPPVTAKIRKKGPYATRGIVLISLKSLMSHLDGLPAAEAGSAEG